MYLASPDMWKNDRKTRTDSQRLLPPASSRLYFSLPQPLARLSVHLRQPHSRLQIFFSFLDIFLGFYFYSYGFYDIICWEGLAPPPARPGQWTPAAADQLYRCIFIYFFAKYIHQGLSDRRASSTRHYVYLAGKIRLLYGKKRRF